MGFALASMTTVALADVNDDVPPVTTAPDGQFAALRGVQGPKGMFSARLQLSIGLSDGAVGEPISIVPDLYYSVTDKLQFGLTHSGALGWQAKPGLGLCVTGEGSRCPEVYDNIGFDVMYGLLYGQLHLSAHGSLFINSFDPNSTSIAVGVSGKAHFNDKVSLFFDPKIALEISDRDLYDDYLYIPVSLEFQAAPKTTFQLLSGIYGGLDGFGDNFQVPVGLGVVQNLNKHFDLGARFSFDNLLGNHVLGQGAADERSAVVLLNVRS